MAQTPQYTWYGLWEVASREAGISVDVGFNTAQSALVVLSEAQHELQQTANAVLRTTAISVSPGVSATGTYDYPYDVKLPLTWQFTLTGSTTPLDVRPITFDEMDYQRRLAGTDALAALPITSQAITVSVQSSTLSIYPYQGVTGELTLKYIPHLLPFDPHAPTGDWSAFTASPATLMKTTGPAREFGTAIMGIKDFLVMRLIEDMAGGLKQYPTRYQRAMTNWEKAKQFAVKDKLQMNARQTFRPHNGLMR